VDLQAQAHQITRLLFRIDLWLSVGEADLDEELAALMEGETQGPEKQDDQPQGEK
jgi:hypothetical protein